MQTAGFRRLDFQIELEIFGKSSSTIVPPYSADRAAAEQVIRRVRHLYPDWEFSLTEDHWGYTAMWQCARQPASAPLVTLGQHRSPILTVAMARASLLAIQNMRRYEDRRRKHLGAVSPPEPEELQQKRSS
jgi:hypothetical protein